MKKILVPTDFSSNAEKAMQFAIRMVQGNKDVHLTFFHVNSDLIPTGISKKELEDKIATQLEVDLAKLKQRVIEIYRRMIIEDGEVDEDVLVKYGNFNEEIINTVKALGIDLIIMGTLGASGLKKIFVGSNTADVMEKAPCPVLAIPSEYSNAPITRVAYATDFHNVEQSLGTVVNFAKFFNASIELFNVYSPAARGQTDPSTFDRNSFLEEIKKQFDYEHFTLAFVRLKEAGDDLIDGIEAYVAQKKPSVIAMATNERMWYEHIFKPSKTKQMIFQTTCPLLVVKQ